MDTSHTEEQQKKITDISSETMQDKSWTAIFEVMEEKK